MKQAIEPSHAVIMMYDAPADLDDWMHGDHYREVLATPGVKAVRRYEVLAGPEGCRKYVAVIETDDLQATLAWRGSEQGARSQQDANDRGVSNRYGLTCKRIY